MYNNLLDRIQRLEQYLTKPCRQCQSNKNSITTSLFNYNNNAKTDPEDYPSILNNISNLTNSIPSSKEFLSQLNNNQPVTLLNTTAVQLITTLKQLHNERFDFYF